MPVTHVELAGRTVHRVGYGAMQLAPHGRPSPSRDDAVAFLRALGELGIDLIDTADFYGDGSVNRAIAGAFPDASQSPVIATKIGARHDSTATPIGLVPAQRPAELRADVEANLRSLGRERLDLVHLRRLDAAPGIIATGDDLVPLDDQLAELVALRDDGLIRSIALSNVEATQLRGALPAGIEAVQNAYSIVDRTAESVLEVVRKQGIAWIPYFPLGSGFPGQPRVTDVDTVVTAAAELGVTPQQVALAWLLQNHERTLLIPGSFDLQHVRENMAAAELDLGGRQLV